MKINIKNILFYKLHLHVMFQLHAYADTFSKGNYYQRISTISNRIVQLELVRVTDH